VGTELDPQSIVDYVAYGNSLGERTIFQAIRKLPPAHWMILDTQSEHLRLHMERYWTLSFQPDYSRSADEWIEELDAAAERAVRRRLMADVPLGCFLSGGVDSSLVTAYAAKFQPGIRTFSIGFNESEFDESGHAEAVARHLGTEHHTEVVTPNALDVLPRIVEAYDEPFADSSAIPTWYLSQMTRQHVTVALSGDGGDELHSGYTRYGRVAQVGPYTKLLTRIGRGTLARAARIPVRGSRLHYLFDGLSRTDFDLYDFGLGRHPRHMTLLREEIHRDVVKKAADKQRTDFLDCVDAPLAGRLQYVDTQNYLPDDILVKVDRASMAHSLEVRSPLLDHEFVELSARIPPELNRRMTDGKKLLKRLAERYIPTKVIHRPKMGFGVPLTHWLRSELRPAVHDMLDDSSALVWGWFDRDQVTHQFRQHLAEQGDYQSGLWRTLFFYHWSATQMMRNSDYVDAF
jgi:asparagine synthase (glutamine-hydrolysing)